VAVSLQRQREDQAKEAGKIELKEQPAFVEGILGPRVVVA
jgi:hypothetical protein